MDKENEIRSLMLSYDKAHHEGDGAKLSSFFLDDAVVMPPGRKKLVGRAAIDNFYRNTSGGSNMKTGAMCIKVDDKMAYVQGETEWQSDDGAKYLSFLNILRRANGQWRYELLTWNTNEGFNKES